MVNIWERQRMEHSSYLKEDQTQQHNGNIKLNPFNLPPKSRIHKIFDKVFYTLKIKELKKKKFGLKES
jgi:hypothetical protein